MHNRTIYIWYTKTKKNVFTFEKKKEIISKIKKGTSAIALSKKLGVYSEQQLTSLKNANEIECYALQMEDDSHAKKKRKTMKREVVCTETKKQSEEILLLKNHYNLM